MWVVYGLSGFRSWRGGTPVDLPKIELLWTFMNPCKPLNAYDVELVREFPPSAEIPYHHALWLGAGITATQLRWQIRRCSHLCDMAVLTSKKPKSLNTKVHNEMSKRTRSSTLDCSFYNNFAVLRRVSAANFVSKVKLSIWPFHLSFFAYHPVSRTEVFIETYMIDDFYPASKIQGDSLVFVVQHFLCLSGIKCDKYEICSLITRVFSQIFISR